MTSETRQPDTLTEHSVESIAPPALDSTAGDIEEFNALVSGWNLEFRQIDRGKLTGRVAQRSGPSSNMTRVCLDRAVAQAGGPPPGMRTFGFREDRHQTMEWCRQAVGPDALFCFHPSEEFECLSPARFAAFTFSFEESRLAEIAARIGHPELFESIRGERAIGTAGSSGLADLRRLLARLFGPTGPTEANANSAPSIDEIARLESEIAEALVLLLSAETSLDSKPLPLRDRSKALRTAIRYIFDHASDAVTVPEVCEAVGVSWRTLDRAFKESLGTSPKRCILGVRLQGVRRDLLETDPQVGIADIANRWGYWHMGDFAMNYRRQFGELPRTTRARNVRIPRE